MYFVTVRSFSSIPSLLHFFLSLRCWDLSLLLNSIMWVYALCIWFSILLYPDVKYWIFRTNSMWNIILFTWCFIWRLLLRHFFMYIQKRKYIVLYFHYLMRALFGFSIKIFLALYNALGNLCSSLLLMKTWHQLFFKCWVSSMTRPSVDETLLQEVLKWQVSL